MASETASAAASGDGSGAGGAHDSDSTAASTPKESEAGTSGARGAALGAGAGAASAHGEASDRDMYIMLSNVAKRQNLGNIVRSASAFGAKAAVVVGSNKFSTFGAHGSDKHTSFLSFHTLAEAVDAMHARSVRVVGVEITPSSVRVDSHPFSGSVAFLMGNEGSGLHDKHKALCDDFVYIPQHGVGTASLNVMVAASIVMHHYALWAGYAERERDPDNAEKFLVAKRVMRTGAADERTEEDDHVAAARAREREELAKASEEAVDVGDDLFGGGDDDV